MTGLAKPGPLSRLRGFCKPDAEVRFLFEAPADSSAQESRFLEAGLALSGRPLPLEEARALPTTWAKKLGFSGKQRSFRDFKGRAV
jgi:hypothetical protein